MTEPVNANFPNQDGAKKIPILFVEDLLPQGPMKDECLAFRQISRIVCEFMDRCTIGDRHLVARN